jgi:hypothetical protein
LPNLLAILLTALFLFVLIFLALLTLLALLALSLTRVLAKLLLIIFFHGLTPRIWLVS